MNVRSATQCSPRKNATTLIEVVMATIWDERMNQEDDHIAPAASKSSAVGHDRMRPNARTRNLLINEIR